MTFLKDHKQFWLTLVGVVVADQLSKYLFSPLGSINNGISFSFFSSVPKWTVVVALTFVLVGVWQWGRELWFKHQLASGLFFGGAVSNLLDRILVGGVRDFLPVPFLGLENNFADYCLTAGLLLILYKEFSKND